MSEPNTSTLAVGSITSGWNLEPKSLTEAIEYAKVLAASSIVPKHFAGKHGDVLVAVQMGRELGLTPIMALRNIAVINGRATVWGDALLAIVLRSPACEYVKEQTASEIKAAGKAVCRAKRRGQQDEKIGEFSIENARTARLWGKEGPWTQYPERMLQMRARGFALRDAFPDLLCGCDVREEIEDIPREAEVTAIKSDSQLRAEVAALVGQPAARSAPSVIATAPAGPLTHRGKVKAVSRPKEGTKGPFTLTFEDGEKFTTFSETCASTAAAMKESGEAVEIEYKVNGQYRNAERIYGVAPDEAQAEPGTAG